MTFQTVKEMEMDSRDRLTFINNLKSGDQQIFVSNESSPLTLYELFDLLETKHGLTPIAEGNEGKVFKFGHADHPFSFIVKIIENAKRTENTEAFFIRWLSKEVAEKGKSTAFPYYIASRKNMIAIEYIDYMSWYPYYLFGNLLSEKEYSEFRYDERYSRYSSIMKPTIITPENRDMCIKSILLQIIHGLYLIQGLNLHGFHHNDLHGQNIMIRKRATKRPLTLSVFSSNALVDIVLPDFGIEAVISDFGLSSYSGIGKYEQFTYPVNDTGSKHIYNDMQKMLDPWIATFKKLKWEMLVAQTEGLLQLFRDSIHRHGFPDFELILNTEMFKDAFALVPSTKDPTDLYISLPPGTKRFTETKKIANEWLLNIRSEIFKIQHDNNVDKYQIDEFLRQTELYLKVPKSLTDLMQTRAGFRKLIHQVFGLENETANNVATHYVLNDFADSDLDEILGALNEFDLGTYKYALAFAIKNNIL